MDAPSETRDEHGESTSVGFHFHRIGDSSTFGRYLIDVAQATGSIGELNFPSQLQTSVDKEKGENGRTKFTPECRSCIAPIFVAICMTACILMFLLSLHRRTRVPTWTEVSLFGIQLWREAGDMEDFTDFWFQDSST